MPLRGERCPSRKKTTDWSLTEEAGGELTSWTSLSIQDMANHGTMLNAR